jgi:plasmid maintenance system antidote protein VapI
MQNFININKIKGLHPGFILERELKKRKIKKSRFALSIQEFPQTLGSITKGKRKMNTPLALKIEQALGLEEGYFMIIQAFYEIEEEKKKINQKRPTISKLRRVLFWDTNFDKIDWELQKEAVIKRVFERGNEEEKKEITRFYGKEVINKIIS